MTETKVNEALEPASNGERPPRYFVELAPVPADWHHDGSALPPGLLLMHDVVRPGGERALITYWASESDYQRDGACFATSIRDVAVVHRGLAGVAKGRPIKWYRKVPVTTWILSATTLLGALDALYNRYELWFAEPALSIRTEVGAASELEVVEGEVLKIKADLRNPLTIPLGNVDIAANLVPAAMPGGSMSALPMSVSEPRLLRLPGNETHELSFETAKATPGSWSAQIRVDAGGGYFASRKTFYASAKARVWPRLAVGPVAWAAHSAGVGMLKGWIDVGAALPQGLSCAAEISRVPGLHGARFSSSTKFVSKPWRADATVRGDEIYQQKWVTEPIEAKRRIWYELFVDAPTDTEWAVVSAKTKVRCLPNLEWKGA